MTHSQIEELLGAYADGELTPAQREMVEFHLTGCVDCQRSLAKFRLTRQQLGLLAGPDAVDWQPDAVTRVTERIQRRDRWRDSGRRLVWGTVSALAIGIILIAVIWLLQRVSTMPLEEEILVGALAVGTSTSTQQSTFLPSTQPTQAGLSTESSTPTLQLNTGLSPTGTPSFDYMALLAPDASIAFYLFSSDLLREIPAEGSVLNLGYRLSADHGAFVIVEVEGGEQIALDPVEAPSIFIPASAQPGDRVVLFAATPFGRTTPAAEFTLASEAEGWRASDVRQVNVSPTLRIVLATSTPAVADLFSPTSPPGLEVTLRLEKVYLTPEHPRQGQPLTVTAVIDNAGKVDARAPVWFGAFRDQDPYPSASSNVSYITIPAGGKVELHWNGRDRWGRSADLSREAARLTFRAGVNVLLPGQGVSPTLLPETDKLDNVAEIVVNFSPYQPQVSELCPPNDNLRLTFPLDSSGSPSATLAHQTYASQPALKVVVHNEGNTEITRVPLRVADADGRRLLAFARWVPPCGGEVEVGVRDGRVELSAVGLSFPITVTLNPADAPDALPESKRDDNVVVIAAGEACEGPTDLWLTADDVALEGKDLLVTVHLSGSPPRRGFWVHAYYSGDGRTIAAKQLYMTQCKGHLVIRFEGALVDLRGGYVMVQIDTEENRVESSYPQTNNTATVPVH
jgi:hypothetical protein